MIDNRCLHYILPAAKFTTIYDEIDRVTSKLHKRTF